MFNATFWMIMAIFIWVLIALIVITFMVDCYIRLTYYKWDKESREEELMQNKVGEIVEAKLNPGGGIEEEQN